MLRAWGSRPPDAAGRGGSDAHLKHLKAHVSNGQVDLGAFPVGRWVEADAVHLQFTRNLQDLEIWFSGSLAAGVNKNK